MATDVVEVDMHALLHGAQSPLKDYNESFERLQMRQRTRPLKIPRTDKVTGENSIPALSPPLVPVKVETEIEGGFPAEKGELRAAMGGSEDESGFEIESELEEEAELEGNHLHEGDVGDALGDEAAMPRHTEADVAFDMNAELEDDEGGAETDSDREGDVDDKWMTDEEV